VDILDVMILIGEHTAVQRQSNQFDLFESQRSEDNSIRSRYGFITTGVPMRATW
jgi:hypothetical protein